MINRDMFVVTKIEFDRAKIEKYLLNDVFTGIGTNGFTYSEFARWQYVSISKAFDFFTQEDTMLKVQTYLIEEVANFASENERKYPKPSDINFFYVPIRSYVIAAQRIYEFVQFLHENRDFFYFLREHRVLPDIRHRIY